MLFTESDHVHESEVCNTEITEKFGKQLNNLDKEEAAMVQRVQAGGWRWEGGDCGGGIAVTAGIN